MARRISINEEAEIVGFMRANPQASVRSVAQRFSRSRPTISDLRSRYALDRPQVPPEVQTPHLPGPPGVTPGPDPLAGKNLFELTNEEFEILRARLEGKG